MIRNQGAALAQSVQRFSEATIREHQPQTEVPSAMKIYCNVIAGFGLSSGDVLQHAFRRAGLAGLQIGGEAVQRRAVRADDLVVVAEVEKYMRMVERRIGADAHELL